MAAYNLSVWDTLPANLKYLGTTTGPVPVVGPGQLVKWDLGTGVINPGEVRMIHFTAVITSSTVGGGYIENTATMDYNDPRYTMPEKHPPIKAVAVVYPSGEPIVYPNPFDRDKANKGLLKIDNLVPGSIVAIYTVSGDHVKSMKAEQVKIEWDGKNRYGSFISPGIYFYTIRTPNNQLIKGKLFVMNSN